MNSATFVDTGYVLALINTAHQWHQRAWAAALQIRPPFMTTEAVLTEIGNALTRPRWRRLGIATLQDLRTDPDIDVVPVDSGLFDRGVALYASRPDRTWGGDRLHLLCCHPGT